MGKKDDGGSTRRKANSARHMREVIGNELRQTRIEAEWLKDMDRAALSVRFVQYLHETIPREITVGRKQRIDDDAAGGEGSERFGNGRHAIDEADRDFCDQPARC